MFVAMIPRKLPAVCQSSCFDLWALRHLIITLHGLINLLQPGAIGTDGGFEGKSPVHLKRQMLEILPWTQKWCENGIVHGKSVWLQHFKGKYLQSSSSKIPTFLNYITFHKHGAAFQIEYLKACHVQAELCPFIPSLKKSWKSDPKTSGKFEKLVIQQFRTHKKISRQNFLARINTPRKKPTEVSLLHSIPWDSLAIHQYVSHVHVLHREASQPLGSLLAQLSLLTSNPCGPTMWILKTGWSS